MVRVNPASLLCQVDLEDANAIRHVMIAVGYYLSRCVYNASDPELHNLTIPERQAADIMFNGIRINPFPEEPLLLEAILGFIEQRARSNELVLMAARDLETLGDARVLCGPDAYKEEFILSREVFSKIRVDSILNPDHDYRLRVGPLSRYLDTLVNSWKAPGAYYQHSFTDTLTTAEIAILNEKRQNGPSRYVIPDHVRLNADSCTECGESGVWCSKEAPACIRCLRNDHECFYRGSTPHSDDSDDSGYHCLGVYQDSMDLKQSGNNSTSNKKASSNKPKKQRGKQWIKGGHDFRSASAGLFRPNIGAPSSTGSDTSSALSDVPDPDDPFDDNKENRFITKPVSYISKVALRNDANHNTAQNRQGQQARPKTFRACN